MALIAHWPLNGDTNDISGNGLHGTPIDITYSDGKIGQAASILNRGEKITISSVSGNILTYAVWHKWDTTSTTWRTIFGNNGNMHHLIFNNDRSVNIWDGSQRRFGYSCPDNNWHHYLVILENASNAKLYVDGEYKGQTTTTLDTFTHPIQIIGNWGSNSYPVGYLNDVRIYNHALTDFEIQELARAKILHYTFDDMQEPTTNVASLNLTSYTPYHSLSRSGQNITMVTASANTYLTIHNGVAYSPSILAFSGIMKLNGVPHALPGTKSNTYQAASASTWYFNNETGYFEIVQSFDNSSVWLFHTPMGNTAVGDVLTIENFQVEQKNHVTEFTPTSRTGQVNDYSGFFNHSQELDEDITPQWIPEAKIGSGAYKLNGNSYFLIHKYNASNDASLSLWFKSDLPTSTSQIVIGSPSSISFGIHNNTIIGMATTSSPVGLLSGSPYTVGQWNHIVITRDASNVMSYYINGIKISNGSNNVWSWNDDPYGIIGRRTLGYAGSAYYTNGEIDDIRVYATALSDKEIKDIYQDRAEILNSGTLLTYDFKQRTNLLQSVNQAIKDKQFKDGLSRYTQANTNVTLTDRGYRIYRTPNVNPTDDGNTMWGGLRINMTEIPGGIPLTKGRSYRLIINTNGKTSNPSNGSSKFTNYMGWGGGGLVPTPITIGREWVQIPNNFNGKHDIIWEFKIEDDIYKVCTNSYSSFVAGNTYPSYNHLQMGWTYQDTGSVGTEVYITGIYLYDITDDDSIGISNKGIGTFDEYSTVGITDGLVGYWPLDRKSKDYSGTNYNMIESGMVYNGDSALFQSYPAYIITNSTNNISALTEYTYSISIYRTDSQDAYLIMGSRLGNNTYQSLAVIGNKVCLHKHGYNNNGDTNIAPSTNNLGLNQWYHIVITYNNGDTKTYVNGVLEGTGMHINSSYSNQNFQFNYETGITDTYRFFRGYMKDAKVFNRALTPEEIAIEYNTMFNNEVQIHESGVLYAKDLRQY